MRTLVRLELLGAALRAGSGPLHLASVAPTHSSTSDSVSRNRGFVLRILACSSRLVCSHSGTVTPPEETGHMVALLHPAHLPSVPSAARRANARPAASRPRHLRLVQTETKAATDPLSVIAVVAVMATVLLVVLVRGVQGAPPASDWQTLTETSAPVVAAAAPLASAATVTVLEGDTWATIAARVEPGADPVEFARSLASANDGYQLHVGQVLVVPAVG